MTTGPDRPRLLVVTSNEVGAEMKGPGIRAYELARTLMTEADVTLASAESEMTPIRDMPHVQYVHNDPVALRPHVANTDAILAQPPLPALASWMRASGARLIFDLYDPEPLEALQAMTEAPSATLRLGVRVSLDRILDSLHAGHHFTCASERQRDLWIGSMLSEGLVRPAAYERDPTFRSVIDVTPFGLPREAPESDGAVGPRNLLGLGVDARVVLWNGGVWNWLDAPTVIRAVARVAETVPAVHLVFMGAPNPASAEATAAARGLAAELGLLDRSVHFVDRQVPYGERGAWLLDADCAVYAHGDHLEARYAFRTRVLDCLWAGVPIVCTRGDHLADRVDADGWGETSAPGSVDEFAAGLARVLERGRDGYQEALGRAAGELTWDRVAAPIARWVTSAELPPRLGDGVRRPLGRAARLGAVRVARQALNVIGKRDWPPPR